MKRTGIHFLLLFFISIHSVNSSIAQNYSEKEIRKILNSREWRLTNVLFDGKNKMLDLFAGMDLRFTDKYFYYSGDSKTSTLQLEGYGVVGNVITLGENVEDTRVKLTRGKDGKFELKTVDNLSRENIVYTWTEDRQITGNALPDQQYEVKPKNKSYTSIPADAIPVFNSINQKLKEGVGNLWFYESERSKKYTLEAISLSPSEMGVKLVLSHNTGSPNPNIWTFEFRPEDISDIINIDMPNDSPLGLMRIRFERKLAFYSSYEKTEGDEVVIRDYVSLQYLKIDSKAFADLKKDFMKLSKIYKEKRNERLYTLSSYMNDLKKFWISGNGSSSTYEFHGAVVAGGSIYYQYYLSAISKTGESRGSYITVVPLKDIEEILLDKSKSKPNTIQLIAGKKGFATYQLDGSIYNSTSAVRSLPLFIDVTDENRRDHVIELLTTHAKELGGRKLSLESR